MASLGHEIDASFYNLIHQLVGVQQQDSKTDHRGHRRRPFSAVQRIAVHRDNEIPDQSEFVEVRCHDLTRGGFSFLLPQRPDFEELVAAFGTPPQVIYVSARVCRTAEVLVSPCGTILHARKGTGPARPEDGKPQSGTPMLLVGCRFLKRLIR